jgi:hypothetical protein
MTAATAMELLARETQQGKWDPRVFAALEAVDARGAADVRQSQVAVGS